MTESVVITARTCWRPVVVAVFAAFCSLWWAASAFACDTPVYRYATYSWHVSPYRVYHISRGTKLPADDPVRKAIAAASAKVTDKAKGKSAAATNLELFELDAAATGAVAALPKPLRQEAEVLLARYGEEKSPRFAVVAPHGIPLYEGTLTADDIAKLGASPARKAIVAALEAGDAGVLLQLDGNDKSVNEATEKRIDAAIVRAGAGELTPPSLGEADVGDAVEDAAQTRPADTTAVKLAKVRIRRDDPAEVWLVRSLLNLEEEIAERPEVMVFSVYGRGRAAPPAIGTGADDDGLARLVRFILGPCACTLRDENPGVDLPLHANWDAIALAMANRFGAEQGNETLLDEFPGLFPEGVDEATGAALSAKAISSDANVSSSDVPANRTAPADSAARVDKGADVKPLAPSPADRESNASGASPQSDRAAAVVRREVDDPAVEDGAMQRIGLGVVAAMAVLAVITFLLRRPGS